MGLVRFSRYCLFRFSVVLAILAIGPQASAQDRAKIEIVPTIPHARAVSSITFSPNGAVASSGSEDETIKLWDVKTGRLLRTLNLREFGLPTSVSFSSDGSLLLSNGGRLWDAATGQLLRTLDAAANAAVFSHDGTRVASGSENALKLWDANTGVLVRTFEGRFSSVEFLAFSPDGGRIVSVSNDMQLMIWDAVTGQLLRTWQGDERTMGVSFSSKGSQFLSAGYGPIMLWDADTGSLLRTFEAEGLFHAIAFSPDGTRFLSSNADGSMKLWDARTGLVAYTVAAGSGQIAFSPDGTHLLHGGFEGVL